MIRRFSLVSILFVIVGVSCGSSVLPVHLACADSVEVRVVLELDADEIARKGTLETAAKRIVEQTKAGLTDSRRIGIFVVSVRAFGIQEEVNSEIPTVAWAVRTKFLQRVVLAGTDVQPAAGGYAETWSDFFMTVSALSIAPDDITEEVRSQAEKFSENWRLAHMEGRCDSVYPTSEADQRN